MNVRIANPYDAIYHNLTSSLWFEITLRPGPKSSYKHQYKLTWIIS